MNRQEEIQSEIARIDKTFPFREVPDDLQVGSDYFAKAQENILQSAIAQSSSKTRKKRSKILPLAWAAAAAVALLVFVFWPEQKDAWDAYSDKDWAVLAEVVLEQEDLTASDLTLLLDGDAFAGIELENQNEIELELLLDEIGADSDIEYLTNQIDL